MTLVVPPLHVSTPAVYRAWDELGGPTARGLATTSSRRRSTSSRGWRGGATASASCAGRTPTLAGSGATWFVEGRRDDALGALGGEGATVVVCRTVPVGPPDGYLRRWWRVRRSIFLCFFFRIRLRRFLINEPIRSATLPGLPAGPAVIPLHHDRPGSFNR